MLATCVVGWSIIVLENLLNSFTLYDCQMLIKLQEIYKFTSQNMEKQVVMCNCKQSACYGTASKDFEIESGSEKSAQGEVDSFLYAIHELRLLLVIGFCF